MAKCVKCIDQKKLTLDDLCNLQESLCQYIICQADLRARYIKGYTDNKVDIPELKLAKRYLTLIEKMIKQVSLTGELDQCYCNIDYSKLQSSVIELTLNSDTGLESQEVDTSAIQQWIYDNPRCLPIDKWEQYCYEIPLVLDLKIEELTSEEIKFLYHVKSMKLEEDEFLFDVKSEVSKEEKLTFRVNEQTKVKSSVSYKVKSDGTHRDYSFKVKDETLNSLSFKAKVREEKIGLLKKMTRTNG